MSHDGSYYTMHCLCLFLLLYLVHFHVFIKYARYYFLDGSHTR